MGKSRKDTQSDGPKDASLRRKAEASLKKRRAGCDSAAPEDALRQLHELEVHQIELEMQNEELRRVQQELEVSRARYFELYDCAPVGYLTLGQKGLVLEANLAASTLLDVPISSLIGQPFSRYILSQDTDTFNLQLRELFGNNDPQPVELRMLRQGSDCFWIRLEINKASDLETGEPVCRIVLSDINRFKQVEYELDSSLRRQKVLLAAIPEIVVEVDPGKKYIWANDAAREFFGEDVVGHAADFYFVGEQAIYDRVECLFEGDETTVYVESLQRRCDGEERLLGWWCHVLKDADGNVTGTISAARDITESKEIENNLRASIARFRSYFQLPLHGIAITSVEHGWLEVNDRLCDIMGYSRDEILGITWTEMTHPDDLAADLKQFNLVLNGEIEQYAMNKRFIRKDGTVIWISLGVGCVRKYDGSVDYIVALIEDITERKQAHDALKISEYRQKAILNIIPDLAWIKDVDGKYLAINKSFAKTVGRPAEDIIGKNDSDLWSPKFSVQYLKDDIRSMQAGQTTIVEETLVDHEGTESFCESIKTPLYNDEGTLLGTVGIARDITARKEMAEKLRAASQKWRKTFDAMLDPVALLDCDGTVEQCNQTFAGFLGLDYPDVLGRKCYELVHHTEDYFPGCPTRAALKSGVQEMMELEIDGKTYLVVADPIFSSVGILTGFVHIMRDITNRKQAEAMLKESELRYRTIMEQAVDAVFVHDLTGRIIDVNLRACDILGYSREELLARRVFDIDPEAIQNDISSQWEKILSGKKFIFESCHRRKDGSCFPVEVALGKLNLSSGPAVIAIARDITERKLVADALQAKNAELECFTYSIPHDLKSPLITIRTFAGALDEDIAAGNAEKVAQDLEFINAASNKMDELLNELLEFSRIGRVVQPSEEISLQELVKEAIVMVAGRIENRGVRMQVAPEPLLVYGDRVRLVEVFQNLIDNAVKFMGDQIDPLIEIGCERKNGDVAVCVRDNGMGIDPRHKDQLFGLFEKLSPDTEGTGLGLALVKRIVETHGGRVWVESEGIGKGACFWFTLPGKGEE